MQMRTVMMLPTAWVRIVLTHFRFAPKISRKHWIMLHIIARKHSPIMVRFSAIICGVEQPNL